MTTTFHLPTKLIFGVGSLDQLGAEAKKLGRKAILVIDPVMRDTGVLDRAVQDLKSSGVESLIFDKVVPNPRTSTVDEGASIVRQEKLDLIIGIGGGSAMDTAKGIVLASTGTKPVWDYVGTDIEVSGTVLPLILLPTTAATGSELDHIAVLTNQKTREKKVLYSPHIFPKVSIVDPELTLSVPKQQTAMGGVDIFLHAMEGYITAPKPSFITDGIVEAIMRTVVVFLPKVLDRLDDIEARTQLSWASPLAISQVRTLGGGFGTATLHFIGVPLTGYYDITHAEGLAALLPAWMKYTLPVKPERFQSLGKNVFGEADGIAATEKWLDKVGMKLRLRDFGIDQAPFEEIAARAAAQSQLKAHPRLLDVGAIKQIYQDSY